LGSRRDDDVVRRHDLPRHVPGSRVLHQGVSLTEHVGAECGCETLEGLVSGLLEVRELEGLKVDRVARPVQLVGYVLGGGVVARRAGRPRAAVAVGYPLVTMLVALTALRSALESVGTVAAATPTEPRATNIASVKATTSLVRCIHPPTYLLVHFCREENVGDT
jgi:hypothetical protein